MTYREFFSHVVDVVEGVGAAILVVGGFGAFARFAYEVVVVLGIIVLIRVVLSFSLEVEIDGMWPWNRWRIAPGESKPESS